MQYVKKSRLPLWAWACLIAIAVTIVVGVTLHIAGIWDLGFLGVWFLGTFTWASTDIVNATMITVGYTVLIAFGCYFVVKYFIGQKVTAINQPVPYTAQVGLAQPTMTYQEAKPEVKQEQPKQ